MPAPVVDAAVGDGPLNRDADVIPKALLVPNIVSSSLFDALWLDVAAEKGAADAVEPEIVDVSFAFEEVGVVLDRRKAPIIGPLPKVVEEPNVVDVPEKVASPAPEASKVDSPAESRSLAGLRASVHPPPPLFNPLLFAPDAEKAPDPRRFALNMLNAVPV